MNLLVSVLILVPCLAIAQPAPAVNAVVTWDTAALEAIRQTHPGPPIVARAMAVVQYRHVWQPL